MKTVNKSLREYLKEIAKLQFIQFNSPDNSILQIMKVSRTKTVCVYEGSEGYDEIDALEFTETEHTIRGYFKRTGLKNAEFTRL